MPIDSDASFRVRRRRFGGLRFQEWSVAVFAIALLVFACARTMPEVRASNPNEPDNEPNDAAAAQFATGLLESQQIAQAVVAEPVVESAPAAPAADVRHSIHAPNLLRVGLATDLEEIVMPCCQTEIMAETDGRLLALTSSLRVTPAVAPGSVGAYRIQVAALKDELQAKGLASRLIERGAAKPVDVVFDAAVDLYRVRAGRFPTRPEAEAAQRTLAGLGVGATWLVSERGELKETALIVNSGGNSTRVEGRWLRIRPREGDGILTAQGRFRGNILIYLNDRGALNLINELSLENYLRGVVPKELGPEVYPSLDALKAQAIAARTYTIRNLGEFAGEGYDICATPRCQVYSGMDSEHPLSDRAISETAGEILVYKERPVDALYSSTCGGHTEDVSVVFPLKDEDYLRGVPCLEGGFDVLAGAGESGVSFPAGLTRDLFPPSGDATSSDVLAARLVRLAQSAGLPIPNDRLKNLARREVQRYIGSLFDLALDARLFVVPGDVEYLLQERPEGWSEEDVRLATYLVKSGLLGGEPAEPLSAEQIEETLLQLALSVRSLETRNVRYLSQEEGLLSVREGDGVREYQASDRTVTFRSVGSDAKTADLALLAGDDLTLYVRGEEVVGIVHFVEPSGATYDRSSKMSSWTRFFTDAELKASVQKRYPGFDFVDFEVLSRGVSGRAGKILMRAGDGAELEVEGLAVRWTLDVPDTLFTAKRLQPPGRAAGWLFQGRGWGHGVGMCQVGAYGMGLRGHEYREILTHYYRGVLIERVQLVDRWTSEPVSTR